MAYFWKIVLQNKQNFAKCEQGLTLNLLFHDENKQFKRQ